MSSITIDSMSLQSEIQGILSEIPHSVETALDKAADKVSKEAIDKLKATSPRGVGKGGHYADSWTRKKDSAKKVTVHNKQYQLTHLLENGHEIVIHGHATGKQTRAIKHIKPVEEWVQDEFEKEVKEDIQEEL